MAKVLTVLLLAFLLAPCALLNGDDHGMCTSPPSYDEPEASCGGSTSTHEDSPSDEQPDEVVPEPLSYFVDITATIGPGLPLWDSPSGWKVKERITLAMNISNGDPCYVSKLDMNVHTGTHIDMPSHFLAREYDRGNFAHKANLDVLIGPALLLTVPAKFPGPDGFSVMDVGNITAGVLQNMLLLGEGLLFVI